MWEASQIPFSLRCTISGTHVVFPVAGEIDLLGCDREESQESLESELDDRVGSGGTSGLRRPGLVRTGYTERERDMTMRRSVLCRWHRELSGVFCGDVTKSVNGGRLSRSGRAAGVQALAKEAATNSTMCAIFLIAFLDVM